MRGVRAIALFSVAGGSWFIAWNPTVAVVTPLLAAHTRAIAWGMYAVTGILTVLGIREALYKLCDVLEARLERRKRARDAHLEWIVSREGANDR